MDIIKDWRTAVIGLGVFLLLLGAWNATKNDVRVDARTEQASVTTLHFTAPVGQTAPHFDALRAWAEEISLESGGRLTIAFDENAKSNAALPLLRSGGTDITLITPTWDLATLGFWQGQSARSNGSVAATVSALWRASVCQQYPDMKILAVNLTENNVFHSTKPGLAGLTFRTMNPVLDARMTQLGGVPMEVTEQPNVIPMMSSGALDGYVTSWTVATNLGLLDIAKYHTVIPGLSTMVMLVGMNKQKYESLPEDLRRIIDVNSGEKLSMEMVTASRRADLTALEGVIAKGHTVNVLPALPAVGPILGCAA